MNATRFLYAMWVSQIWYDSIRNGDTSRYVAYCRARGTVLHDRILNDRVR